MKTTQPESARTSRKSGGRTRRDSRTGVVVAKMNLAEVSLLKQATLAPRLARYSSSSTRFDPMVVVGEDVMRAGVEVNDRRSMPGHSIIKGVRDLPARLAVFRRGNDPRPTSQPFGHDLRVTHPDRVAHKDDHRQRFGPSRETFGPTADEGPTDRRPKPDHFDDPACPRFEAFRRREGSVARSSRRSGITVPGRNPEF